MKYPNIMSMKFGIIYMENMKSQQNQNLKQAILLGSVKQVDLSKKGYLPNWSEEIFIVRDRRMQRQPVYYLRDLNGEHLSGAFYEPELQRVVEPTEYRVERVIRSRTTRGGVKEYFVKWKGWNDSFNSWVKDIHPL